MEEGARIIALIDMDCFYVQVEERDHPEIKGVPAAVVQYKTWQGGGIIAVNYEARDKGVTRNMRGDMAKKQCPEIILVRVPETNGKADLTKYREAGREVVDVICTFSDVIVERASIDEVYVDLTEAVKVLCAKRGVNPIFDVSPCLDGLDQSALSNCFPIGCESMEEWISILKESDIVSSNDVRLAVGAEIVGRMRKAVLDKTGFRCSAGIAHNKVLAKLGGGLNKPNKQTIISHSAVTDLYSQTKIQKVRMLGGQVGDILVEHFKVDKMIELLQFSLEDFSKVLGPERAHWLYQLARGYDNEPVSKRELAQSVGCSKNFRGPEMIVNRDMSSFWIKKLAEEIVTRLQTDLKLNNRKAKILTLHVKFLGHKHLSRVCAHKVPFDSEKITASALAVLDKLCQEANSTKIVNLGLIASKLEEVSSGPKITSFCRTSKPGSSEGSSAFKEKKIENPAAIKYTPAKFSLNASSLNRPAPTDSATLMDSTTRRDSSEGGFSSEIASHSNLRPSHDTPSFQQSREQVVEEVLTEDSDTEAEVDVETCTPDQFVEPRFRSNPRATQRSTRRLSNDLEAAIDAGSYFITDKLGTSLKNVPNNVDDSSKCENSTTLTPVCEKLTVELINENSSHETLNKATDAPLFTSSVSPRKMLSVSMDQSVEVAKLAASMMSCASSETKENVVVISIDEVQNKPSKQTSQTSAEPTSSACSSSKSLIHPTENVPISDSVLENHCDTYLQTCPKCGAKIPVWEIPAHEDFHVASELQRELDEELRSASSLPGIVSTSPRKASGSSKRGSPAKVARNTGSKRPADKGATGTVQRGRGNSKRGRGGQSTAGIKTLDSWFTPK